MSASQPESPAQPAFRADADADPGVPLRSAFDIYVDGIIHDWNQILTALGLVLIPLFFALDTVMMPSEFLPRFGIYRATSTLIVLAQYFVVKHTRPGPRSYLHGYFFSVVVGGMIARMTSDLGGFDSAYYAGLNLVIVAVNLLLPWRALHSAINGVVILSMYLVANVLWGGAFVPSTLISNLYFLASTVVIAVAINHSKYKLIEKEFHLRAELVSVNLSLDRSRKDLAAARDALWGEMEVAKRIQTALLPRKQIGGYEIAASMQPADEVGGDYYDFFETPAGEAWACVGDVSGHGVESGLVMMMTQTSILSLVTGRPGLTPADVFHDVNRVIRENVSRLGTTRYMTLNLIRLLPDRLVVAGKHQDLLVFRKATGAVEAISNEGTWIGVVPDTTIAVENQEVRFAPGDVLLLYTDGVTEAQSASGEMFGEQRLLKRFGELAGGPLDAALEGLRSEVARFQATQQDDVTLLLLRRA